jgi:hypothetical protein
MILLAQLLLLAIVCGYSWMAYRIKTTAPEVRVTVPKPLKLVRAEDNQ